MTEHSAPNAAGQVTAIANAAQRLLKAGFHRILPVIPPDAPMPEGTNQKTLDARGKMPGVRLRGGLWGPMRAWQNSWPDPKKVPNWDKAGANVGLLMGQHYAALDVDVTDPKLSILMKEALNAAGIVAPVRVGRAPKFLLLFRVAGKAPVRTKSFRMELDGAPQLVEVLGTGRQAVIWGRHPGGFDYTWDRDIMALGARSLPEIEPAELHDIAKRLTQVLLDNGCVPAKGSRIGVGGGSAHSSKEGALARNPEALVEAFGLLPNDYGRADWIRLGQALKAAAGPEHQERAMDAWEQWSTTGAAHTNPQTPAKEWGTMNPDGSVGAGTIIWELDHRGVALPDDLRDRIMKVPGRKDFDLLWTDAAAGSQEAARAENQAVRYVSAQNLWSPLNERDGGALPLDVFPPAVAFWVQEKADAIGVKPLPLAVAVIAAASMGINGETRLTLSQDWDVPAALWFALVGGVSAKKTPVIQAATRVLNRMTRQNVRDYDRDVAAWERQNHGVHPNQQSPFPAWRAHYTTTDMTVEALASVLAKQDRGIGMLADELVVFIEGLGAYKHSGGGKDVGKMLSAFNGGDEVVHRATGGRRGGARATAINNWLIPVLGGVQPGKVVNLGGAVARNGLLERFLPAIMGDAVQGSGKGLTNPGLWDNTLRTIAGQWVQTHSLSLDAAIAHGDFLTDLYELKQVPFDDGVLGALGKLDGVVGRLALVLHYIHETANGKVPAVEIPGGRMDGAIRLVRAWIVPSLLSFWENIVGGGENGLTAQIARFLLRSDKTRFRPSDFKSNVRALRGKTAWEIDRAMGQFVAGGWLVPDPHGQVSRVYAWELNPAVRERFEAEADKAKQQAAAHTQLWEKWREKSAI